MASNTSISTENGRKRHNIIMAEETRGRAEKIAQMEKRSFSNLLEVLVDREWERLQSQPQTQEVAG